MWETNTAGDGEERNNPIPKWKPEHPSGNVQNDGAAPAGHIQASPDVGEVPGDIVNIGYDSLDAPLGRLVTGRDDWSRMDSSMLSLPWNDRSLLTERQTALAPWWDLYRPRLNSSIESRAMYFADNAGSGKTFPQLLPDGISGRISD